MAPALAQPCAITIDNDTTICQGQTVTLHGPAGFPNYAWSNGALTQNTTVSTSGLYTCQVSYPTGNLAVNGNFSAGNTGFSTQYNYNSTLTTDGNYWIGSNAAAYHPQWSGTGNGQFLIVNAGWQQPGVRFWCETLPVCPGQTYTISFRAASLASSNPPTIAWFVNNGWTGDDLIPPAAQATWQTLSTTWTAPAGVTSADFCAQVSSGWGVGNDLGFDDVVISSTVVLTDAAQVTVTPLPPVNLGPNAFLCTGQTLALDATAPGATYLWQDGSTNPGYTVTGPGNYNVAVTANGCTANDAITVNYNPVPVVNLGPDQTLCVGQNLNLNVFQLGATYVWQNGSNTPSYTVTGPGTYSVTVTAGGCSSSDAVDVAYNPMPVVMLGPDQTLCAGDQLVLDATTTGGTYVWQDGSTGSSFNVTGAGVYDVDVTVNGCTSNDDVTVNYNPLPVAALGPDQTLCAGQTLNLNVAQAGATYLWQDGSTNAAFTVSGPGTYSVDVTLNGCSMSDAIDVAYNPLPVAGLGPDQTLCAGQTLNLSVPQAGATYLWQDGSTNSSFTVSGPGTYSVDVTLNGCSASDAIDVAYNPLPVANLGPDVTLCAAQTLALDVSQAGATFLWQDGSTNSSFTVIGPGIYSVDVTLNGCSASDAIDVAYTPVLVVDLGPDQTLCVGDQIILDATTPGGTYLWQDGSTDATFTVTSAGNYSVDVTANNCAASDAATFAFNPIPVVDLGPDQTVCPGIDLTFSATAPGATYLWQDGSTAATLTSDQPGNFSVQVTAGGCAATDAVAIAHFNLQTVDLGPDVSICQGTSAALSVNVPGATYLWSTGSSSNAINPTAAGIYWVDATLNGCTVRDSITVSITPLPVVDLGNDVSVCPSDPTLLDATMASATYLWSTGAVSPTINGGPGNYSVTVTVSGCSDSDGITVNAFPAAQADLGNDTTLCPGEQLLLDASQAGASYVWQDGSTDPDFTVTSAGTYSVDLTDANGCVATDDINVAYASASSIELGNDTTICLGEQLVLDATLPGASYLWSTGEQTPTISVGVAGNVSVTVTQGTCSVSDGLNVQVTAAPTVDLGPDVTLCPSETLLLDATYTGATYLWNTGDVTATLNVTTDGTYSVAVTNAAGCTTVGDIIVAYASPSSVNLGSDIDLCTGQSIVFDAMLPGATYMWSTGEQTSSITVGTSAEFWVEVTQGTCSVSDSVVVNVNPAPQIDLGPDLVLCPGDDVLLDAEWPGATYAWSTGDASSSISAGTTGLYSVTVDLNGCVDTDDVTVTVLSPSAIDLGPDLSLCAGSEAQLDATIPGATYLWSNGATTATLTASNTDTYWVEVTQGTCTVTDTVDVGVFDPGSVELGPDVTACEGDVVLLDATLVDATYLWDDGSTGATRSVSATGDYTVQATVGQCSVGDLVHVTFNALPQVEIGSDVSLCPQATAVFDATVPGASYIWQDGSTAATFTASNAGQIAVTVTLNGCDASDNAAVAMLSGPTVELGNDTTLCEGASLVLDATQSGATYLWDDGSTGPTHTVSTPGAYAVQVTLNGCAGTDHIVVDLFAFASLDLGPDVTLCPGESALLNANTPGNYTWSDGTLGSSITVQQGGTYWIEVEVAACTARDSILVFAVDLNAPDLGDDQTICDGESVALSVVPDGASVVWSTGSTADAITVAGTGTYSVTLELNGCIATDEVNITMLERVTSIDLGGDQLFCPGEALVLDATTPGANYVWSTGANTAVIAITSTGTYTVELTGPCIAASASVVISAGDCDPLVFVPNSFTPNGDGFNDVFFASVYGPMIDFTMDIFDRWGERIHSTQLPAAWDGTVGGSPVQDGVYVYKVRYRARANGDVVAKELIGHVTLLR